MMQILVPLGIMNKLFCVCVEVNTLMVSCTGCIGRKCVPLLPLHNKDPDNNSDCGRCLGVLQQVSKTCL